jgi:hypothetical protein
MCVKLGLLTLREGQRLRMFEKRVLKGDEVTGSGRKLHNEELYDLHYLPNIIRMIELRRIRWAGHVARMGEKRNAYTLLVGKPEGKRSRGRPRCMWVGNIKIDLSRMGWYGLDQSGSG